MLLCLHCLGRCLICDQCIVFFELNALDATIRAEDLLKAVSYEGFGIVLHE